MTGLVALAIAGVGLTVMITGLGGLRRVGRRGRRPDRPGRWRRSGRGWSEVEARIVADLPLALDLIAACLAAGAPLTRALATVADAVEGPLGEELAIVAHGLWLGGRPDDACHRLAAGRAPALTSFARALRRADESGSRLAEALRALADAERAAAHARAVEAARKLAVFAVGPLALCFLPAFVLLGVVPVVASAITKLAGP